MKPKIWRIIVVLLILSLVEGLIVAFLIQDTSFAAPHSQGTTTLTGTLAVVNYDPAPDSGLQYRYTVHLIDNQGNRTRINLDLTMASRLQGETVEVTVRKDSGSTAGSDDDGPALEVESIRVIQGDSTAAAINPGSYPIVNILCKFGDIAAEPSGFNATHINGLHGSTYPGLSHYWNQLSGGTINLNGTIATTAVNIQARSTYFAAGTTSVGITGLSSILQHCVTAADPQVNFSLFNNINLILNANLSSSSSGFAYGGYGQPANSAEGNKTYRVTWLPPWGWQNQAVVAHETGHGFGLPHSAGPYGSPPGPYDSVWDVMSDTWDNCYRGGSGGNHPTYGCLAQGTNGHHLGARLGWIPVNSAIIVQPGQTQTVTLERLNQPSSTGIRVIQVPYYGKLNPNTWLTEGGYSIEARRRTSTPQPSEYYDAILPADAVIVYDVYDPEYPPGRSEPVHVIDIDGDGDVNDAGAQWIPGEIYVDYTNNISVRVLSQTNTGFSVQVSNVYGDSLARFNPANNNASLLNTLLDNPTGGSYSDFPTGGPTAGQWVMGDWNGDGLKTPGLYGSNGVFYFTNSNANTSTWGAIWIGLVGRPAVAGRFNAGVTNDCIGVVDSANFPPYGMAYAMYFTCNFTGGPTPTLALQWLSVLLPDAQGHTGAIQFGAGDYNSDGIDTISARRSAFVAFTNVPPTTLESAFDLAQYFGTPSTNDYGVFVAGDWNNDGVDSFGIYYNNGYFYRRSDLAWNSGLYTLQRITTTLGATLNVVAWRAGGGTSGSGQPDTQPQSNAPTTTLIESDNPVVNQDGAWQFVNAPEASGGGYLTTTSPEQTLELDFSGTSVEVIYAQLGAPAAFTILVDDVAVRTVILPDPSTAYLQRTLVNYLEPGEHTLRIVSMSGPVAIDAFNVVSSPDISGEQTIP